MTAGRDSRLARLHVRAPLAAAEHIALAPPQANYLVNVLRLQAGDGVLVFNGRDGEWLAHLARDGRRPPGLVVARQERPQPPAPDLHYLFAPLKHARLDYMVGKAVEMGAGRLRPILTQHGQVSRVNRERMAANAVEAAEQCGILTVPEIDPPAPLRSVLDGWPAREGGRRIVFCDEGHGGGDPLSVLARMDAAPLAVLVGPEGGFSRQEQEVLRSLAFVTPLPLGPRILRADTAAVAALALVQAAVGDWKLGPGATAGSAGSVPPAAVSIVPPAMPG